jgi:hypothetical protein
MFETFGPIWISYQRSTGNQMFLSKSLIFSRTFSIKRRWTLAENSTSKVGRLKIIIYQSLVQRKLVHRMRSTGSRARPSHPLIRSRSVCSYYRRQNRQQFASEATEQQGGPIWLKYNCPCTTQILGTATNNMLVCYKLTPILKSKALVLTVIENALQIFRK